MHRMAGPAAAVGRPGLAGAVLRGCHALNLTVVRSVNEREDPGVVVHAVETVQPRALTICLRTDHPLDLMQRVVEVVPSLEILIIYVNSKESPPPQVYDYLVSSSFLFICGVC